MASILLRPFKKEDLDNLRIWSKNIDARRYMSRVFPKCFNENNFDNSEFFDWFVIVNDGIDVGCIWLEKEHIDDNFVQLGIIIGNEELFSKGIGREAIEQVLRKSKIIIHSQKVRLNVRKNNIRAQACYTACGFSIISQDVKTNDQYEEIEFFTMEKTIPNLSLNQKARAERTC